MENYGSKLIGHIKDMKVDLPAGPPPLVLVPTT